MTKDISTFMQKYFHELPIELQNLIMSKTYRIPKPKFKKGDLVRYTQTRKIEMHKNLVELRKKLNLNGKDIGEQPFGKLTIWCKPHFNYAQYEWMYDYEYGLFNNKEGSTIECHLEKCG